jgi:predicted ATPase/signal transduction histidine kinase
MPTLPDYQIGTQIYESANSLVCRGVRKRDNQPVILKMLKQDYPTPAELTRYRQEYEMTRELDLARVIKAYCIEKYQNTLVIVLEDFGGESLKTIFEKEEQISVSDFLPLAIQITEALNQIHAANIIHKDINPANLVWNKVANQLKIIDFGIASRLPRENPTLKNPEQLEGTLAYISPEQTGRMNRSLDYRTDLYSLGVMFYELLTGKVPFESDSAMELVHCHIAKTPKPVCEINPKVPPIISGIVMKLMAKNVEDRYQSAFGVKADLEKIQKNLTDLEDRSGLQFELAQNDFSGKLQIPQKLYGREKEINTLLQAFERMSGGATEMMLVAGYSGVGKTALVHEVHKPMTSRNGYFASGKFDQFQKNIPYSAISQAFNQFCRYLLMESAETLDFWQTKILAAVGNNGQVIIDVIPDLELIIGPQPKVASVGPTEAQNRFQMIFLIFVKILCDKEHPFILFIDDLQWVDLASLNLLKSILLDDEIRHLLIIGAYRDNEVDSSHPFVMAIDELEKANAIINTIKLANLLGGDVNHLLQESLFCEMEQTQSLTDLIYQKTQGNAFFTHQFLQTLYQDALLRFDFEQLRWQWDVKSIAAQNITDNVVALMTNKISKLPIETIKMLKLAACIGNSFNLKILSLIGQQSSSDTLAILWSAIEEGLLVPVEESSNLLETSEKERLYSYFKFQHDRIQYAAYSLLDNHEKQVVHLRIGHLLLANTPTTELEERLFDLVNQLNQGIELLTDEEKPRLFQLNVDAGAKALNAMAYQAALAYIEVAKNLLSDSIWTTDYAYAFKYYMKSAECLYLNNQHQQAIECLNLLYAQVQTDSERIDLLNFKSLIYTAITDNVSAKNALLQALYLCGIDMETEEREVDLPKLYQEIVKRLQTSSTETLINAPPVTNAQDKLFISSLVNAYLPLMRSEDTVKTELSVLKSLEFVLNKGNDDSTPLAYVQFGAYLCNQGEYLLGAKCGKIAMAINKQYFSKLTQSQLLFWYALQLLHFGNPIRDSLAIYHQIYEKSTELGDFVYAGYATTNPLTNQILCGVTLSNLKIAYHREKERAEKVGDANVFHILLPLKQLIDSMEANTVTLGCGDNSRFSEQEHLAELLKNNLGVVTIWFMPIKTMLLAIAGNYEQVIAYSRQYQSYMDIIPNSFSVTVFYFYYVLALLKNGYEKDALSLIKQYRQKYEDWAKICPPNYHHKYCLLEAESAKMNGNIVSAMDFYEQAIASARENKYLQEEALAYELAAEFYLGRGMEKFAQTYLKEAHYHYQQWGAVAKVRDLEKRYPKWLAKQPVPVMPTTFTSSPTATILASTRTRTSTSQWLDLESVMKASQTLSSEMVLSRLLEKMMRIVIENAGAERGFLILPQGGNWIIEAEGAIDKETITTLQALPIKDRLPEALISYVARTRENVVLIDAKQEGLYTENPYIKTYNTQSVLCFPIVYQQQLRAILYFENNLTTGAFTETRLNMLKMLSSQIAISLENAQWVSTLDTKVKERTAQLNAKVEELTQTRQELVQSEKMASLGRLVAGFAHELNTPLGVALSSASLLRRKLTDMNQFMKQDEVDEDDLLSILDSIDKAANLNVSNLKRAANLVTSFKRTAVDQTSDKERIFQVQQLIQDTINTLHSRFKKTEIEISVSCPNDLKVKSLPGALEQILTNLLMNSLIHGFNGGQNAGTINIKAQPEGDNLQVEYSDNGKGIAQENLAKIFEPFFTTHRAHGGSGLGMYICYNLITTQLQGTITCESVLGEGVIFKVDYPVLLL